MALLEGKTGIIFGVANKRSFAWAIAQKLAAGGAQLAFTYQGERIKAGVEERSPLRRHVTAEDVGAAAAYLLGDGAVNVTGTTLYVDSGYHALGM